MKVLFVSSFEELLGDRLRPVSAKICWSVFLSPHSHSFPPGRSHTDERESCLLSIEPHVSTWPLVACLSVSVFTVTQCISAAFAHPVVLEQFPQKIKSAKKWHHMTLMHIKKFKNKNDFSS